MATSTCTISSSSHTLRVHFRQARLEASHVYSDNNSGLAEEVQETARPLPLHLHSGPPASNLRVFIGQKLTNELYIVRMQRKSETT